MSSEIAISVQSLSKTFQIYDKPKDRLLQMFARSRKRFYREFAAVKDVSFEIRKGETIGIIGRNGSGKSTLLQMICGTLNPSSGTIQTSGRVAALLELGSGFNPEFTGRENIFMNAAVLGLTRERIAARLDDILNFAEIGEFVDQPVKTYSSGMMVRLAFAVIAHVDADILIIDEALAVGDAFFTQKCMRFLRNFMKQGTVLFVSHDTSAVVNLCSKAFLLEHGVVTAAGSPKAVSEHYLATLYESKPESAEAIAEKQSGDTVANPSELPYRDMREDMINGSTLRNDIEIFRFDPDTQKKFGLGGATVASVRLLDANNAPLAWVVGGQDVSLEICCVAREELVRPIIGFQFKDRLGQVLFADNTFISHQFETPAVALGKTFVARFEFRLPILPSGDYSIGVAVADGTQDDHVQHQWLHDAQIIRVHASSVCFGLIGVPMKRISLGVT